MAKSYRGSKSYFLPGWHWIKMICYSTFYSFIHSDRVLGFLLEIFRSLFIIIEGNPNISMLLADE